MPKLKKIKVNEATGSKKKRGQKKIRKSRHKFNKRKIFKERKALRLLRYQIENKIAEEAKNSKKAETIEDKTIDEEIILEKVSDPVIIDLNQDCSNSSLKLIKIAIPDICKYKITLKINVESIESESCLKRLLLMSVEENVILANVHFNYLMKANWSPALDDLKKCFSNWSVDLDCLNNYKTLEKHEKNKLKQIRQHNIELLMNLISYYVLKTDNGFSSNDLLILAKLCVAFFFDNNYRKPLHIIKQLFSDCIEKALDENDEIAFISFNDYLWSIYTDFELGKLIINVFLPIQNNLMKKLYTYLAFKLYLSLLGVISTKTFPYYLKDWFVHDIIVKSYFCQKPFKTYKTVIKLLEHVVIILDLYQDEENLNSMYNFYYSVSNMLPFTIDGLKISDIVDEWRARLQLLHIKRLVYNQLNYINRDIDIIEPDE